MFFAVELKNAVFTGRSKARSRPSGSVADCAQHMCDLEAVQPPRHAHSTANINHWRPGTTGLGIGHDDEVRETHTV